MKKARLVVMFLVAIVCAGISVNAYATFDYDECIAAVEEEEQACVDNCSENSPADCKMICRRNGQGGRDRCARLNAQEMQFVDRTPDEEIIDFHESDSNTTPNNTENYAGSNICKDIGTLALGELIANITGKSDSHAILDLFNKYCVEKDDGGNTNSDTLSGLSSSSDDQPYLSGSGKY